MVRGANITSGAQHTGGWRQFWTDWDWASWIKPQIDDVVSIGANCVRILGCPASVTSGDITQAQYLAQWAQVLDYTASLGVMAYPCGGDLAHWGTTTLEQAVDVYAAWAGLLDTYDHVIGVDLTNEAFHGKIWQGWTQDQLIAYLTTLAATVRASCGLAVTNSRTVTSQTRWADFEGGYLSPLNDFEDFHLYYTAAPADLAGLLGRWWGQQNPFLLGEFGAGLDLTSPQRTARYESVGTLLAGVPQFRGALAWAGYDTNSTPPATQLGLFDPDRAPRTDITVPFQALPTTTT